MSIFAIIGAAIAAALIFEAVRQYRKTPGTAFVSAFYQSATIALARGGGYPDLRNGSFATAAPARSHPNDSPVSAVVCRRRRFRRGRDGHVR